MENTLIIRDLGVQDYQQVWDAMQTFTQTRKDDTQDEFWLVQHPAVFTQGVSGKAEHVLDPQGIPIVQSNRGGQVTYHGPGQIVAYVLLDIRRKGMGIRALVTALEETINNLLANLGIESYAKPEAPGVYVEGKKIAALGLRVSKGCSYHGLSLNVDMDLTPFSWINPCGFTGLEVTQLKDCGVELGFDAIQSLLVEEFVRKLRYTSHMSIEGLFTE